jgi:16S rRNA (guanine527-N7)-methyltransferase
MGEAPDHQRAFLEAMHRLGVDVSRETVGRLDVLVHQLQRWQKAVNLVSRRTLGDIWIRHILDSAQVTPLIPAVARTLVDLGSGAGFPGMVIAALRPDLDLTLIESDARKAAFLVEAARSMSLARQLRIQISRIETTPPANADVVTARALAPLSQLLSWAQHHRLGPAICLFHKGKGWRLELTEAMKDWDIPYQSFTSVTDRDAVILRIGQYTPADVRHCQPEGRRRQDDDGDQPRHRPGRGR